MVVVVVGIIMIDAAVARIDVVVVAIDVAVGVDDGGVVSAIIGMVVVDGVLVVVRFGVEMTLVCVLSVLLGLLSLMLLW